MTRTETMGILTILKVTYPNFYKQISQEEIKEIVNVWAMLFENDSVNIVKEAVKALICTLKFPPTIADVKDKIALITQTKQVTELEAWGKVLVAIQDSNYHAKECFDKLPKVIQTIIGSPNQLREWAAMESEIVNSVIQSNFMRSYKLISTNEKELSRLPESAKELISGLGQKFLMG